MLLSFVKSPKVSLVLESCYVNDILSYLRKNVFTHEELFARCFFLHIRAFDAYSNTPHEGTNRGSKHCKNRVLPNMSQAQSTKVLTEQDAARTKSKRRAMSDAFHKTQVYSHTATSQHLLPQAESMLQVEMEQSENYVSVRIDSKTWWVLRGTVRKLGGRPIPVFERVRVVWIDKNGCMQCSCGYTC